MKYRLLLLFLFATTAPLRAAALVEGRIYLKNGSVVECTGDDRLQLPKIRQTENISRRFPEN